VQDKIIKECSLRIFRKVAMFKYFGKTVTDENHINKGGKMHI
jgi:hypothetical protein